MEIADQHSPDLTLSRAPGALQPCSVHSSSFTTWGFTTSIKPASARLLFAYHLLRCRPTTIICLCTTRRNFPLPVGAHPFIVRSPSFQHSVLQFSPIFTLHAFPQIKKQRKSCRVDLEAIRPPRGSWCYCTPPVPPFCDLRIQFAWDRCIDRQQNTSW